MIRPILTLICALFVLSSHAVAAEKLKYVVQFKGGLTLYKWVSLADATITTEKGVKCDGGVCENTRVFMTSEKHGFLESLYPTRFYYSSYYRTAPMRTVAFEKRQKKRGKKYEEYPFQHKIVHIDVNNVSRYYSLWATGDSLPGQISRYATAHKMSGAEPKIKDVKEKTVAANSLDRWAMIQLTRRLPLKKGYTKKFPGTSGKDHLTFELTVIGEEKVEAAGQTWKTWKLRLIEHEKGDEDKPPLNLWIAQDENRTPVQVEMEESIGRARFMLVKSGG